ncbi:helix-turn-helix domain-containing protein [Fictibacillus sp. Mic-4]|uniref:helix-turn-helix domain-containing protein n=1 Tax=Fictibacillus TaxID=1329200 RepID=UPI000410A8C2|nr:helix-turn-helix domain-containing protein [Fictibacillus gelatini]HAJ3957207.1 helix-turn-helix domain-containing protein [Escherichia coli]
MVEKFDEELLTQSELCEWLKIGKATAYRWRQEGMPHIGSGKALRYQKSEVIKWLEERGKK